MAQTPRTLLINWVYQPPVGHVIEALRLAQEFAAADPELEISLLLNQRAPIELACCLPVVSRVYPIDVDKAASPTGFPIDLSRNWDYVFTDPRAGAARSQDLNRFHAAFKQWVVAGAKNSGWDAATMPRRYFMPLRLELPPEAEAAATARLNPARSPTLCALLGAGSYYRAPSLRFWTALFQALQARHPRVEIVLLGSFDQRRTSTQGITRDDVDELLRQFPTAHDAFDCDLLTQLALAKRCAVHISPHSGMSFAVQAVGVPWLALAGQEWHEFLLNGVPLVSVLPDCPLYPCFREMYQECHDLRSAGKRTPCIDDTALLEKMPEILDGIECLLAGKLPYRTLALKHEAALRARLGPDTWVVVDWPNVVADDYIY